MTLLPVHALGSGSPEVSSLVCSPGLLIQVFQHSLVANDVVCLHDSIHFRTKLGKTRYSLGLQVLFCVGAEFWGLLQHSLLSVWHWCCPPSPAWLSVPCFASWLLLTSCWPSSHSRAWASASLVKETSSISFFR